MIKPKGMGGLGFKDFKLFNLAMLTKPAWRILQHPESLSARLLKIIYFFNFSILDVTLGSHLSHVSRAIIEGRDTLKQGLIIRIGNGETTRIYEDNWFPRDEMLRPYGCLVPNPSHFCNME